VQPIAPLSKARVRFGEEPGDVTDGWVIYLAGAATVAAVFFGQWRLVTARAGNQFGNVVFSWHKESSSGVRDAFYTMEVLLEI